MPLNPKNIGGALAGAYLTNSSTDQFDPLATTLGAAVGGVTGNYLDFSMPRGTTSPINTRINIANSFNNPRDFRANMLGEITSTLNARSQQSNFSGDFSFTSPLSTIHSGNVGDVLNQYNAMSNTDLQKAYVNFKNNRNVYTSLQNDAGIFGHNAFTPHKVILTENASLSQRQDAMFDYLRNVSGESEAFARQRVNELTPFLGRLESGMTISDGSISTKAFGQNFNLSLTQTLGDGRTTGYVSNNNVYLANQYNLVGGLLARGQGVDSPESFDVIAKSLGLEGDSSGRESLKRMLTDKRGVTKEAALGMLATMGVSDDAMLSAIEGLESNKQWDEYSTSEYLKKRIASLNGTTYERQVSEYATSVSNLIDFSKTVNYSEGATTISEHNGSALRNMRTVADSTNSMSEMANLRRHLAGEGFDMFSQVKADAVTKLADPDANVRTPTPFIADGRNPLTVGRRALQAPSINSSKKTALDGAFETFKNVFHGEEVLDSSVALRTRTLNMDELGNTLSKVLGGNVTLADGHSLANKQTMSRFTAEGVRKVSIPSDAYNNVALKNPLMSKLINNEIDLDTIRHRAGSADHLVRFNTAKNQEKVFGEFMSGLTALDGASDYNDAVTRLVSNSSDKFENQINKMLDSVDKYKKQNQLEDSDPELMRHLRKSYFDQMSDKIKMQRKGIDLGAQNAFAGETLDTYNSSMSGVLYNLRGGQYDDASKQFQEAIGTFNNRRRDALDSSRMINSKGGATVGYGLDGEDIKLPESYTKYNLAGVSTNVDSSGKASLDLIYSGKLGLDENYAGKGFGINSKEQFLLTSQEDFGKAGVIGMLHDKNLIKDVGDGILVHPNATASGKEVRMSYDAFNKGMVGSSIFNKNTANLINSTFTDYARNVDMISDTKGTGFEAESEILRALKNKEAENNRINPTVWNSLREYQDANNVDKSGLRGLVNYSLATTNEKASLATLANVFMSNEERFEKLNRDYIFGSINSKQALAQYRKLDPNFSPTVKPVDPVTRIQAMNEMRASFESMQQQFSERFSDRTNVYNMLTDENHRRSAIDYFVRSSKFTSDSRPSRVNIAALNRTAVSETGAGTIGKSMSWNAQLQLLGNGYSYDDLDTFAKFDKGSVNDLNAITGMIKSHNNSFNQHFDYSKNTQFKNAFNSSPEDRRDMFKKLGINTGNDVDFYNLSYSPEGSFKSIPIMYEDSRLFDDYTSTRTGEKTNRRATSLMYEIIQSDMELQATQDESVKASIRGNLDKLHSKLQGHINPALSGSTSVAKAALTRDGGSSTQSTVGAIAGEFTDFLESEKSANRHTSYVAVSQEGAMKRLGLAGIDLENLEELNNKHLERIGKTSLYKLKVDGEAFFGLVNREPATGPLSARLAEYVVDMSIKNSKGASNSLFIRSEDPLYKLFQFGDYDFDNVTEYFMEDMQNQDASRRASVLARGRQVAYDYGQLEKFADKLGVKNNKSKQLASLFDVYEKNKDKIKTEEDWHNTYLNYLESTTKQSGLRKVVSPQVTMLSAALNNSLMRASEDSGKSTQAARVLTHYFVENLLKAQYASNQDQSINTVAEDLSNARKAALSKDGSRKAYLDLLSKNLTDMLEKHKGTDLYKIGEDAVSNIVSAESLYMTDKPINSMELGMAGVGQRFDQRVGNISQMINGEEQAIPLFRRVEDIDIDVAKTARVGYDRFKNITNQFLERNKKTLAIGAIGLGGVALAFQSKPNSNVTADVGRQTLAPATMSDQESSRTMTGGRDFNKSPEYITPHRDARRSVTVEGQYVGNADDYQDNSRRSIFGDNIDSAQVEYRE